jgi:SAM-dependent methyltransferase
MIDAFNIKLSKLQNPNLCAINHLLTSADSPQLQDARTRLLGAEGPHRFDLVVSHLTLHHIADLEDVFATMWACLRPGGMVALTDYEDFGSEAIRFHPVKKRPGVEHHGIKRGEVEKLLVAAGFEDVRVETAYVMRKEVAPEEGMAEVQGEMEFPFLMMFGVKK